MRTLELVMVLVSLGLWAPALAQEPAQDPARDPTEEEAPEGSVPDAEVPASTAGEAAVAGSPKTVDNDVGFGEHQLHERFNFPDPSRFMPRVDRRDEIDASSDRTIIWPTAHTPHKHTLAISNHMLVMSQLSYSFTDDVQVTGTLVVPIDEADTHLGLSAKFTLSESENHVFSIQPFTQFRRSELQLGTSDAGVGVAALVDLMSTNNLVFTLGAVAYGTFIAITQEFTAGECASRQEFLNGDCRDATSTSQAFPAGGHFVGGQIGFSWYIFDSLSLRGEFMTGVAAGSVLGTEWLTRAVEGPEEAERFTDGTAAAGLPYDTNATMGLGLQWSNGTFAVQFSGYGMTAPVWWDTEGLGFRDVYFMPMLNVGMAVF